MYKKKAVVALLYDFDQTLSVKDQQEYSFIPSLGITTEEFWNLCDIQAKNYNMDKILSYMLLMINESKKKGLGITRNDFKSYAKGIKFLPGVEDWFERINAYGKEKNVQIEHYIISSGLKEIMESTPIARYFTAIFGCEFHYDEITNQADFPAQFVNYTAKTQYVFRISKGALDLYDESKVNSYVDSKERHVPYENMIYIGDGLTDVPCMKLITDKGGTSIAILQNNKKEKTQKLLKEKRVTFSCLGDYREGKELDLMVKKVIEKISIEEEIKNQYESQLKKLSNGEITNE